MIAIVDSGSSKSDWVFLDAWANEVLRTKTIGFNPYFVSSEQIAAEIRKNEDIVSQLPEVTALFFYGAGCSSPTLCSLVEKGLSSLFKKAKIKVEHDLLAACYAAYQGKPTLVGILGTGSNTCFFDGKKIHEETPSLGFILGDEGSGNHLGRELLRSYYANQLPLTLQQAFEEKYPIKANELIQNIYQNPFANAYLASFSQFVGAYKTEPYIQEISKACFRQFFEYQVTPYKHMSYQEFNCIGSIAHHYQELLTEVAQEYQIELTQVVQRPIDKLVEYHTTYLWADVQ